VAGEKCPLGVSYVEPVIRTKPPRKRGSGAAARLSGFQTRKKDNREFDRWQRGIAATDDLLRGCEVVHIADRESDSYELMAEALQAGRRFVFRVRTPDRKAKLEDGSGGSLGELAAAQEGTLQREVPLSTRKPQGAPHTRKVHRPRKARLATLRFSATPMQIVRPRHLPAAELPKTLGLHVVRIWEPTPPDHESPVEWLLFTTEPIDTPEQVASVVDMYRARWLIEECNKALKSGCLIEHRQFESREALLTVVALSLPIACEILALRAAARENPDRPATDVLTPPQIDVLRRLGSHRLSKTPTARDALWAVAAMGGHQRSNGEPGWLVLQRGMSKLLDYELAYNAGWSDARGETPGTDL
jgi:hypothetical protein